MKMTSPDTMTWPSATYSHACSAPCAIIVALTLGRHGCIIVDWSRPFDNPIIPPKGNALTTLKDAAAYIMKLPKAQQNSPEWQAATEALLMAAEDRGPLCRLKTYASGSASSSSFP